MFSFVALKNKTEKNKNKQTGGTTAACNTHTQTHKQEAAQTGSIQWQGTNQLSALSRYSGFFLKQITALAKMPPCGGAGEPDGCVREASKGLGAGLKVGKGVTYLSEETSWCVCV